MREKRLMSGVASGFHFALEPEGRLDAVRGKAVEDRLDRALVGACCLGVVLERQQHRRHHQEHHPAQACPHTPRNTPRQQEGRLRLWSLPGSGGGVPSTVLSGAGCQGVGEGGDGGDEVGEGCGVVFGCVALASSPCGVGGLAPGGQVGDCFAERA